MTRGAGMVPVYCMQVLIAGYAIWHLVRGNHAYAAAGTALLGVTVLPYLIELLTNVFFTAKTYLIICGAVCLHGAGDVLGLYRSGYPVFDKFTHLWSAASLSLMVLVIVLLANRRSRTPLRAGIALSTIVVVTVGFGVLWELFEFACDCWWQTGFQMGPGDTAGDLAADLAGALLACAWIFAYLTTTPPDRIERPFLTPKSSPEGRPPQPHSRGRVRGAGIEGERD